MSKLMNNPIEDEIDTIRIELYEEMKDMTTSERVAYMKASIAPLMRQYNLKSVARANDTAKAVRT